MNVPLNKATIIVPIPIPTIPWNKNKDMIKDKITKKIGEILSGRDSTEMAFTKGFETTSGSKLSHSKLAQN